MDDRTPLSEIMTHTVVKVLDNAPLLKAARLMRTYHVSGLPVIDKSGKLIGVISEKDLVRGLDKSTGIGSPRGLLDLLLGSAPPKGPNLWELCQHRLENGRVHDVMTPRPVVVGADATIHEAARLMRVSSINRLPVVDDGGKLVGIVTRADVVEALADVAPKEQRGSLRPPALARHGHRATEDIYADV
jgi:CBS domain-containing protein